MSRKSARINKADSLLVEPPTFLVSKKVTRVFKRKKNDDAKNSEANKENNINTSNTTTNTATEKKRPLQISKETHDVKSKEEKPKVKKAKRESVGKAKKAKTTQETDNQNSQLSDFLKQQQEFFKNVDEFELSVVEEQPQDTSVAYEPETEKQRSDSPFLKDLIEQEFKKKEQEQKRAIYKYLTNIDGLPRPMYNIEREDEIEDIQEHTDTLLYMDDSFCAPPIQVQDERDDDEIEREREREIEREDKENGMFMRSDYDTLEEELDIELEYLKVPKRPSLPRPFLPCTVMRSVDPTESDFPQTPATAKKGNSSYAYDEYKMVVAPVGTPMSFADFMAMQRGM